MAGVQFAHPDIGTLNLRLAPTSVDWAYELVTSTVQTYAGEVVQVLAINFSSLAIEGMFGKEGPHGATVNNGRLERRSGSALRDFENAPGPYAIGLTQMTEFFQRYFAVASQGHDARVEGHFDQTPMTLKYQGSSDIGVGTGQPETWQVYPVSFPSYARSLQDFAPKWRVECEVFEAPENVHIATQKDVITQLSQTDADAFRPGVGYRPFNPFSDPFKPNGEDFDQLSPSQKQVLLRQAQDQGNANVDKLYDSWRKMLPAYDDATLTRLIQIGGSMPLTDDETAMTKTTTGKNPTIQGNHGGNDG
jgi:hypothetical protein